MEFDLGHIDEGSMYDGVFVVYIDDKYVTTIEKSAKAMVSKESVELNYGNQLRIEYQTGVAGSFTWYGFANILLYK